MFAQEEVLPSLTLMSQTQANCSKTGIVLHFLIYSLIILFLKICCKAFCISGPTLREPCPFYSLCKMTVQFLLFTRPVTLWISWICCKSITKRPIHKPPLPKYSKKNSLLFLEAISHLSLLSAPYHYQAVLSYTFVVGDLL